MQEFKADLDRKMAPEVEVTMLCRGGTGLQYIKDNIEQARGFDMLLVMTGGNDVANGKPFSFFQKKYSEITAEARHRGVRAIVFSSIWPRKDTNFNNCIRQLNDRSPHNANSLDAVARNNGAVFWDWDRRQPLQTFDGVHLKRRGYQRSIVYLVAAIVWAKNHTLS